MFDEFLPLFYTEVDIRNIRARVFIIVLMDVHPTLPQTFVMQRRT
jgi:hypothetical protein